MSRWLPYVLFILLISVNPFSSTNICFQSCLHSYSGLVSFWIGREKDDKNWIARGVKCKDEIERLVVSASTWNFQNSEC